ncbi:MAG: GNAT family N-acetyltransferase [Prolixibacteraceae bacterium]|jgi:ribosomal protein S18 acetylase RimI-like enzyme|nr:GNAT family N-acetyltransferase [Prolixibacteraceae bacterium]
MNDQVLQNMVDLHHDAAISCQLKWGQDNYLHWVNNTQNHWPRSLIGTVPANEVMGVVERINKHKIPPFWVFESNGGEKQSRVLEQNGFREIYRWQGMMLASEDFNPAKETSSVLIESVIDKSTMQQWAKIVKDVMLSSLKYTEGLLLHWFENEKYKVFIAWENEKPVSAGLAYLNDNVAGIYFIATLPEHRGNGYASSLVSVLIKNCFDCGTEKVVLHASEAGQKMYHNMGFKITDPISTYWKVGTF